MSDIKKIVLTPKTTFTATVQKIGGRVTTTDPITVKNQVNEIRSLDDIPGVNTSQRVDGATIVYNANTNEYEVRSTSGNVVSISIQTLIANSSPGLNGQVLHTNGSTIYWSPVLTSNNATFAYGKRESDLSVNFAQFSGNANFAFTSNLATRALTANVADFAFGKRESDLSVNFSQFSGNANFAFTSNLATYAISANTADFAFGKRESDLSVNFAQFSGNANFSFTSNNASFLEGLPASYFRNASNLITGQLDPARLANSGVVSGTYGNSTAYPVVTVDQYGRLTTVTTSPVSGISDFVYTSGNNTFGIVTGTSTFYATIGTVSDFVVTGNLIVQGTTTTVNTQNLDVKDAVIRLNQNQITPFNDIGILMQRYSVANSSNYNIGFAWKEANTKIVFGKTPEDGSDSDISFSQEWMTISQTGDVAVSGNLIFNVIDGGTY
jgi:hypothetical protein